MSAAAEVERERIAEAIHVARFDHQTGKVGGPDSFYNGMLYAERLACQREHGDHGGVHKAAAVIAESSHPEPQACTEGAS